MDGKVHDHREHSLFEKEKGEWKFLDAQPAKAETVRREEPKVGRNDPCPCGSGSAPAPSVRMPVIGPHAQARLRRQRVGTILHERPGRRGGRGIGIRAGLGRGCGRRHGLRLQRLLAGQLGAECLLAFIHGPCVTGRIDEWVGPPAARRVKWHTLLM
mgnify:CR=1 FL=1